MTTGVNCPTCATGISPSKDQPCTDCEIGAMHGLQKIVATTIRDLFFGSSRQEPPQKEKGCVRFVKDREPGQ